jgi:hypothetical protein
MTVYVADGHGNWFEVVEGETDRLYIVDTDDLNDEQKAELKEAIENDGAEDIIKELGRSVDFLNQYNEGAQGACEWLEEVYGEGIHETDAWKEYVGAVEGCDCEGCDEEGEGE